MITSKDYPLRRYLIKQVFEEWEDEPNVLVFEGRIKLFMNKATSREVQLVVKSRHAVENIIKIELLKLDITSFEEIWANYLADGYKEVDSEDEQVVEGLKRIEKSKFKYENERLESLSLSQEQWENQLRLDSLLSGPTQEEEVLNSRGNDWTSDYDDYIGQNSQE